MSIKSPSGRLARWALQIQQYDLDIQYNPGKTNVVPDCLSRPPCNDYNHNPNTCDICTIQIDIPSRTAINIREEQLKDPELNTIVKSFEEPTSEEFVRYTSRGYLMNNGVLYRYNHLSDTEEAVLVIPKHETGKIINEYHDQITAGHCGVKGTLAKLSSRYYWTGMRQDIINHVNKCPECQKYKITNMKPTGLIQTTPSRHRFEIIAIDLFGPLPTSKEGYNHILIVEDTASRWVELIPLQETSAITCASALINQIFLRYSAPRRINSDNGVQFVSAIMQKLTFALNIEHTLIPVYHPQANMVERKNRDLKYHLSIMVNNNHSTWSEFIPAIQFAMNTTFCSSTGFTAAY